MGRDDCWYFVNGERVSGIHERLSGDVVSDLRGDVSNLRGDVTDLEGDVTGLWATSPTCFPLALLALAGAQP